VIDDDLTIDVEDRCHHCGSVFVFDHACHMDGRVRP
jgi:hypothetical protein